MGYLDLATAVVNFALCGINILMYWETGDKRHLALAICTFVLGTIIGVLGVQLI